MEANDIAIASVEDKQSTERLMPGIFVSHDSLHNPIRSDLVE